MNRCPAFALEGADTAVSVACLGGAGVAIAAVSAGAAWTVRGATDARHLQTVLYRRRRGGRLLLHLYMRLTTYL